MLKQIPVYSSLFIALSAVCAFLFLSVTGVNSSSLPTHETIGISEIEHRAFEYFWNESDPATGLTRDRASNFGRETNAVASIAATGYALSAIPIGVSHKWVSRQAAYSRTLTTLRFIDKTLPNTHGWYYHFVDIHTGARVWNCEISSIDTGLLLMGVIVAGQSFPGTDAAALARRIVDRTDFRWMQTRGSTMPDGEFLSMGWKPESGWLPNDWSGWNESPFLYILAMGSPNHSISADAWSKLSFRAAKVEGYAVIGGPTPLFMAQMGAGLIDFRNMRDSHGVDLWVNSVNAHRANHAYCVHNTTKFKTYAAGLWGVSANDLPPPAGYGAQSDTDGNNDGTVSPSAAITSILFTPDIGQSTLQLLATQHKTQIWGKYGFSDALNVDKNWYDRDVIGIDLGMMLVALEDYRTGLIWHLCRQSTVLGTGLRKAGFRVTHEQQPRSLVRSGKG